MFEAATNKGLEQFLARKQRERNSIEFFKNLDDEVEAMKASRIGKIEIQPKQPFGFSFASHRSQLKPVKHDSAGKAFVDVPLKTLQSIYRKKKITVAEIQTNAYQCFYCKTPDRLTIDHIIATSMGGSKNGAYNKVYACDQCNSAKGNFSLEVFIEIMSDPKMLTRRRFGTYSEDRKNTVIQNIQKLIKYRDSNDRFKKHELWKKAQERLKQS